MLGLRDALAIGIGATVGPGIFTVIAPVAGAAGYLAPLAFLLSGFALLFSVLAHARLASAYPSTGGLYVFVTRAFGSAGGFLVGWSFCLSAAAAGAFVALGFADYLGALLPVPRLGAALGVVGFFVLLNLMGVRRVVQAQKVFTSVTLAALVLLIAAGLIRGRILPELEPPAGTLLHASLLTFTLFAGFEVVGSMAGEVRRPARVLPLAMLGTLLTAICVYTAVAAVAVATLAPERLAGSQIPLAEVARGLLGTGGGYAVALAVLMGSLSVVNAQLLVISRILSAAAGDAILPERLIDFRGSTALAGALIACLILGFRSVAALAQVSSLLFVVMLISTNLAYLKLFRPGAPGEWLFSLSLLLPAVFLSGAGAEALALAAAWLLLGIVIFVFRK